MALSRVDYTGTGSVANYAITFGYLDTDHVKVYINTVIKVEGTDYSFPDATHILLVSNLGNGAALRIKRQSGLVPLVDFSDGAYVNEDNLDTAVLQALYTAQEAYDAITEASGQQLIAVGDLTDITAIGEQIITAANAAAVVTLIAAAQAVHTHAASDITSGTLATARLGSGSASAARVLRGDQSWNLDLPTGQCRLTKSGANLLLSPIGGNALVINSAVQAVPDAGITLAPTALAVNTVFYIYAFMNAGTMTLEASATVPVAQAGTGVQIKTGDATRSLVGMARTITGPAWADTATQRFVLSHFNRRSIGGVNALTANVTVSSAGTYVEVSNTDLRIEFLTWADDAVRIQAAGIVTTGATVGDFAYVSLGVNSNTAEETFSGFGSVTSTVSVPAPFALTLVKALTEGYNFVTVLAQRVGTSNAFVRGSGTAGLRSTICAQIRG
jgi:hypothetical protein